MSMKDEIWNVAKALGYDGDEPESKTEAVHAIATAAGGVSAVTRGTRR
jgi:hypothetical protein